MNSKLHGLLSKTKFSYSTYLAIRNESSAATATLGQTVNNNNTTTADEEYARAKPYSQIPAPHSWPIIGNTLFFANKEKLKNAADFHKKMFNEYGPIYKMKSLPFSNSTVDRNCTVQKENIHKSQLLNYLRGCEKINSSICFQVQDMMRPKSALFYIDEMSDIMDDFIQKEYVQIMDDIGTLIMAKVKESIQKHKVDGSLEGSILGKLIEKCGYDSDVPLIMAADALAAGIDTTGNTAAFLLYHLATNPDKQEILYQEIIQAIGKDGKMTETALAEMRFLKACQQESMRLAPVAMGTTRTTCQDIVLSGYQVPKGIYVMRVGYLMQNNEEYFQQPDKFLPERWIRGCPQHQKLKNAYANIPFGHGPRACIGQRFAKLELYMVAFKLIQKYKISYDGPEIGIDYIGLGSPNLPLKLKFEKRN